MNKRIVLWLMLVFALTLSACSGSSASSAAPSVVTPGVVSSEQSAAPSGSASDAVNGLSEPIAEYPVLITSAGQSADFEMIKVMFDQNKMEYTADTLAAEEDLDGIKTLVVAIGGSSKGLGAAGIDADAELERVKKMLDAAQEKDITIISAHIGGDGRRGKLGDRYIEPCVAAADYVIVVESGNKDGLFTELAGTYEVPMDIISNMTDAIPLFKAAFKS